MGHLRSLNIANLVNASTTEITVYKPGTLDSSSLLSGFSYTGLVTELKILVNVQLSCLLKFWISDGITKYVIADNVRVTGSGINLNLLSYFTDQPKLTLSPEFSIGITNLYPSALTPTDNLVVIGYAAEEGLSELDARGQANVLWGDVKGTIVDQADLQAKFTALQTSTTALQASISELLIRATVIETTNSSQTTFLTNQATLITNLQTSLATKMNYVAPGEPGNILTSDGAKWMSDSPDQGTIAPPSTTNDPHFNNVVALLHFEGVNNAVVFTDVKGHAITVNGNTKISTDQFKFGTSSGYFDGTGDYLSFPVGSDFQFSSGDLAWECWCRPATVTPSQPMTVLGNAQGSSAGNAGLFLAVFNSKFIFRHWASGSSNATSNQSVVANTWYHVVAIKVGTILKIFVDGVQGTNGSTDSTIQDNQFRIGTTIGNAGYATDFSGYIDEVRITKGIARYAGNFTVPTEAFPNS